MRRELEAMLRAGQYQTVVAEAKRWFANCDASDPESMWVAIMACGAEGGMAHWRNAVAWADIANNHDSGTDMEAAAWLSFLLGTALMYTGDLLRSERELLKFCNKPICIPSVRQWAPDGLYNLGFVMRFRKQSGSDVEFYRKAAAIYATQGRHAKVICCHREIAWTYLLDGRPALALGDLEAAEALISEHGDPELAADAKILRAFFEHAMGLIPESMARCEELTAFDELMERQRGDIAWLMGRNALRIGDVEAAAEWAEEAEECARQEWWPPLLDRVKELKSAIAQHSRTRL